MSWVLAVLLVLLLGSMLPAGASAAPTSGHTAPGPVAPAGRAEPLAPNCSALSAGWSTIDGGLFAPAVAAAFQSPCAVGHDVPGMYFVSNASESGSRFQVTVTLPGAGSSPGSAFASFWVGLWVAGIPCSMGGLSYLTVELLPPYSVESGVPASANWSVFAPVWDLVPPGTCDAQCQNDSAFVTVAGRSYCEDDAVLPNYAEVANGPPLGIAGGSFSPGDIVSLAFAGTVGSGTPLEVRLNDSQHPADDLAWAYTGISTVSGRPLTPFYAQASPGNGGWTGGLDVGVGWENCPSTAASAPVSRCNSYNGPLVGAAGVPTVDLVSSFNASTHGYSDPYSKLASVSSSGGCSGVAGTSPCAGFTSDGGTGAYPLFAVDALGGRSWFAYGTPSATTVSTFGGLTAQFPANGNLSAPESTTAVSPISDTVGSSSVAITARVSDPFGVAQVDVTAWWCSAGGLRHPLTTPATASVAPGNTRLDGNWTANFATNGYVGEFFASLEARSISGALAGPFTTNFSVTGAGTSCSIVPPPPATVNATTLAPLGGGYRLSWTANLSAGISSYEVVATPLPSGTAVDFPRGNVTTTQISGLKGNTSYSLRVVSYNPAGLSMLGPPTSAGPTYYPLLTKPLVIVASSTWVNQTSALITANVTGGLPPFSFYFNFGDGSSTTVFTTSGQASVTHPFTGNYSGDARIAATAADSAGDTIAVPIAYVPVLAAPLAPSASIAAGNGYADVTWGLPVLPPGLVPTNYTVYWTTDPAWAPYLTVAWPGNNTVPAIHVTNVPSTITLASLPVPNGVEVFAQVVAWDTHGEGLLPAEPTIGEEPYLSAVPAPFASPGIVLLSAGGVAPFTEQFSTEFTTGTGTVVVNATYRFTGGASVVAPITGGSGTFWANASYTFETPGPRTVYLYAVDSVSELLLLTSSVYVAPAPGPLVTVSVNPSPVFVNASVQLSATPTGGSGQFAYAWDLGDGTNSSSAALSHAYSAAGTYLVHVLVTDTVYGGSTEATTVVPVYTPAAVSIGVVPGTHPGEYVLAAFATGDYGALSYVWLFGDGTQSSGATVTHTWAAAGLYEVTVRVSDLYGHSTIATTNLTVTMPTTTLPPPARGLTTLDYGLIALVVVLAALLVVVGVRSRRPKGPRPPAPEPEDGIYHGATPPADMAEEGPSSLR